MALNVYNLLTSLENLMSKNNTTTSSYDVSSGLQKRVKSFYRGIEATSEFMPIAKTVLPAVVTELNNKVEEYSEIGRSAYRNVDLEFSIVSIVEYGVGKSQSRLESDWECIKLTQNIESLIRNYITLSSTCDWCFIKSTGYGVSKRNDFENSMSKILISVHKARTN